MTESRAIQAERNDDYQEVGREEVFRLIEDCILAHAVKIHTIDSTISDRPGLDWEVEVHFYIEKIGDASWQLFEVIWDDNYGIYIRSSSAKVSGTHSVELATDMLLATYLCSINVAEPNDPMFEGLFAFAVRTLKSEVCPPELKAQLQTLFSAARAHNILSGNCGCDKPRQTIRFQKVQKRGTSYGVR